MIVRIKLTYSLYKDPELRKNISLHLDWWKREQATFLLYKVQQMSCKEKNLSSCVISQEEKYTFLKKNQAALYYNDHSTRMFPVFVQGFDSLHT